MRYGLLLVPLLLVGGLALAQTPAPGGPGVMVPPGRGMRPMPGGGQRGMGPGLIPERAPAIEALPQEKKDKLHTLQSGARDKMMALNGQMEAQAKALAEAMRAYPIDAAGAKKAQAAMVKMHGQMFDLRLQTMTQGQQIIGKDAWTQLVAERQERGMQPRGPGMRRQGQGPGMMPAPQGGQK